MLCFLVVPNEREKEKEIGKAAVVMKNPPGKNHLSKDIIKDISLVFIFRSVSDISEKIASISL